MELKQTLFVVLKMTIAASVILWLAASDKLDFNQLRVFEYEPLLLFEIVGLWFLGYVLLGGLRWYYIIHGMNLKISYMRAVHLNMIGLFFNTTLPGAVGGDLIKTYYLVKEHPSNTNTAALLTVLLDRAIGLVALLFIGGIAVISNFKYFLYSDVYWQMAVFILTGAVVNMVCGAYILTSIGKNRIQLHHALPFKIPRFHLLTNLYDSLQVFRNRPQFLLAAITISILIRALALFFAYELTRHLTHSTPDAAIFTLIFSVGIITTVIPLAPGGIGIGHLAFEKLFDIAELGQGANIFNVMTLGILALNLLGVVPYLLRKTDCET